jgi:hypothetical protein
MSSFFVSSMKVLVYILSILVFLSACRKEEKKHTITYKVIVISGHPTYSLTYSSFNNTTKVEGSITTSNWTSPPIDDRKKGSVSLTLNGGNGGSYKMYIYVDGYLETEDDMYDPSGPKTIKAEVKD